MTSTFTANKPHECTSLHCDCRPNKPGWHHDCSHRYMTNVLVVYATREGQTEKIARHIAKTLTAEGHAVKVHDADRPASPLRLANFQVAVVGGPIHGGNYPRSLVRFVRGHRQFLESVPSTFFSVGLAVQSSSSKGREQTLEVVERFVRRTGWRPARVELIAGALLYTRYNFLIRFVMKRIVASEGGDTDTSRDYEYTDWPAVERFARQLVGTRVDLAQPKAS